MIRGVFILTATGNILFEKVWAPIPVLDTKVCFLFFFLLLVVLCFIVIFMTTSTPSPTTTKQKTIVNALLTTLHVLAGSATGGMHLAHIALATLGVTAASDARTDVKCFLFHDEDRANELGGYEFGRLVAGRLLSAFTDAYAPGGALVASVNKAAYGAFAARLLDVIAGADRDILRALRCTPGVSNCVVVADAAGASPAAALGHQATVAAAEIEEIGFLANFRSFVAYSEELSLGRASPFC